MFKKIKFKYYIKKFKKMSLERDLLIETVDENLFFVKDNDENILLEVFFNQKGCIQYLAAGESSWHWKLGSNIIWVQTNISAIDLVLREAIHNLFAGEYIPLDQLWNKEMFVKFDNKEIDSETILNEDWWKLYKKKTDSE